MGTKSYGRNGIADIISSTEITELLIEESERLIPIRLLADLEFVAVADHGVDHGVFAVAKDFEFDLAADRR